MKAKYVLIMGAMLSFFVMSSVVEVTMANEVGKVNINTAAVEQLLELNGIGQTKAEAIVKYREEHGDFSAIDELVNVSGIGDVTLKVLSDAITVRDEDGEREEGVAEE